MKKSKMIAMMGVLFLCVAKLKAQSPIYERTLYNLGSTSNITALGLGVDTSTNLYLLGQFSSPTKIGSTVLTNIGGVPDIFLHKRALLGGFGAWARAPLTDYTIDNAKIGSDIGGNSYLAGTFHGTNIAFGSSSLTNYSTDYSGDIFFAKYDPSGNLKWLNKLGGTGNDLLGHLVVATNGVCFLTGTFQSPTFTAGSSNLVMQGTGSGDCFTAKYDASGNLLWLEQASNARGTFLALDASTNCYVGGYVTGPALFDGQAPSNAVTTNFLAKYYNTGGLAWVRGDLTLGNFIGVDAAQSIYTAGTFSNTIHFGSLALETSSTSAVFIAKYDSNGNPLWAQQLPGKGDDGITGLVMDGRGNCWVSGYLANTLSPSNTVAFIAHLDPSGGLDMSQITSPMSLTAGIAPVAGPGGATIFAYGNYATNFALIYHSVVDSGNTDIFMAWVLAPPSLATVVTGTNFVCSWPNTDTNLMLESSPDLSNWSTVTNSVSTANGKNSVTNAVNGGVGFYRLRLH